MNLVFWGTLTTTNRRVDYPDYKTGVVCPFDISMFCLGVMLECVTASSLVSQRRKFQEGIISLIGFPCKRLRADVENDTHAARALNKRLDTTAFNKMGAVTTQY